jgi:hypothetical protein
MMRHTAADATASAASWTPPLLDPIHTAGTALAQGDSSFIAVVLDDSVRFPGITAAMSAAAAHESVRVYSPQSTGLRGARWAAFVPKVVPYAAAYNAVVQIARQHSRRRA